jgi:hypothetical protein
MNKTGNWRGVGAIDVKKLSSTLMQALGGAGREKLPISTWHFVKWAKFEERSVVL